MLELQDVTRHYGARRVLDGVSLRVASGEAVGLVGVNGAGKTTLIRSLLDLTRPDGGSIAINGDDHRATRARRHLSYLAERFQPPHFATGCEFLRHLLALAGRRFDRAAADAEARALDLEPAALDRAARHYSKGMAQKLGLIGALLPRSPLLVLDEPMSGLDPRARALFKRRLGELKDDGVALFFSTHLLVDVQQLCDRIAVLDRGRIVFDGPLEALLEVTGAGDVEAGFLALTGG